MIDQTIREKIAHIVAALVSAPARRRATKRIKQILPPQERWPWQDLEDKIFRAARSIECGADLTGPLNHLLERKRRCENIGFIAELHRRGVTVPDRIRRRAIDILTKDIADPTLSRDDFPKVSKLLDDLDHDHAVKVLDQLFRQRETDYDRRLELASTLATLDQETGILAMERLIAEATAVSTERLRAARKLEKVDPSRAKTAYVSLVSDPKMGSLRVDAAVAVASINGEQSVDQSIGLLQHLTMPNVDDPTRYKAASSLAGHRRDSGRNNGLRTLAELSESSETTPEIRLNSAIELWRHDRELGLRALTLLVDDRQFDSMLRIKAAWQVTKARRYEGEGLEMLLRLTVDSSMTEEACITAGRAAGELEPIRAAGALSQLVGEQRLSSTTWLAAALAALDFDPSQGLSVLIKLIKLASSRRDAAVCLRAAQAVADKDPVKGVNILLAFTNDNGWNISTRVKSALVLVKYDRPRGILALIDLAGQSVEFATRLDIADRVSRLDHVKGSKLIAEFANSKNLPVAHRISAAKLLAGVHPKNESKILAAKILVSMTEEQQLADRDRLAAALAALEIDLSRGLSALIKLAKARIESTVLLDATKAVAVHNRSEALELYIAFSKERRFGDKNRLTAAEAAAKINRPRGVAALTDLANDRSVSWHIRRKATEAAQRLG